MSERTRIALPSMGEGGLDAERSGHFGHSDCFTLVDVVDGQVEQVTVVANPPHIEGGCLRPVQLLASHGVNALVVAGMGARPLAGFRDAGISVLYEAQTPSVGAVINMALAGELPEMDARSACGEHH